jgi:hypothetical protein
MLDGEDGVTNHGNEICKKRKYPVNEGGELSVVKSGGAGLW